ncbi:DUF5105 domain-containing protein [Clostridium felsineum]|uniref:DUF5105 domain-containing protein n=1 Tax=Clostridium felsineum TaxID=36839 RepID=UPI00098CA118|nr:DUF5105 domain-containing protein [Clostridium felsineum]URZ18306.1 hypothetical protein CLFE_043760 [Clostridium felsineum DSM 794]
MKKKIGILIVTLLVSAMLMGCTNKLTAIKKFQDTPKTEVKKEPKIDVEKSAQIMADLIVKDDKEESSKFSFYDKLLSDTSDTEKNVFTTSIKQAFLKEGIQTNDAQWDNVYNAYRNAVKKVTITAKKITENDKTASVKIEMTYINFDSVRDQSAAKAKNDVVAMHLSDLSVAKQKYVEAYANNLVTNLNSAEPSTDKKTREFDFKVNALSEWVPTNISNYETGLMEMARGK